MSVKELGYLTSRTIRPVWLTLRKSRKELDRRMFQTQDWKGALQSSLEVLKVDPDHLGALEVLAQAQWYGGQYAEVIVTTTRLLRLNPLEPGYRYTRGMALLSEGDLKAATTDFRQAMRQSNSAAFCAQVSEALHAVETFMDDRGATQNGDRRTIFSMGKRDHSHYPFH